MLAGKQVKAGTKGAGPNSYFAPVRITNLAFRILTPVPYNFTPFHKLFVAFPYMDVSKFFPSVSAVQMFHVNLFHICSFLLKVLEPANVRGNYSSRVDGICSKFASWNFIDEELINLFAKKSAWIAQAVFHLHLPNYDFESRLQ